MEKKNNIKKCMDRIKELQNTKNKTPSELIKILNKNTNE